MRVTFTGIDDRVSKDWALGISQRYPSGSIEFALLVGSKTGHSDYPIFPAYSVIDRWRRFGQENGVDLAIHLCGKWSRLAFGDQTALVADRIFLLDLVNGFSRVQVNFPQSKVWTSRDRNWLWRFFKVMEPSAILQHRGSFDNIPFRHPKVQYLYDISGGRGINSIEEWPDPPEHIRVGYSGGLGPDTIDQAIPFFRRNSYIDFWIDMESGIRENGYFDPLKAESVLGQLEKARLI